MFCLYQETFDLPPSFFTTPPVIIIINEMFDLKRQLTSVCACICYCVSCLYGSETERRHAGCFSEPAYLPNPSSVAKDPLPRVPPSRCHLGNHCRGELPAGIADLCWLSSTELQSRALPRDVCDWTDMQYITQKTPKNRLM